MTFWEDMKSNKIACAVGISFCIAAYEEQRSGIAFDDNSLKDFMSGIYDDIIDWLDLEMGTKKEGDAK